MTNRERIVRTLQCQEADRPPFAMWLGFAPWGQTLARWRSESGIADLDVARYFGLEPFFAVAPLEYGPFPPFEERRLREDAEFVVSVDRRGIVVRNRRDGNSMPEFLSHPIKTPDDWARYKAERLQPRLDERLTRLEAFAANAREKDLAVQVGSFPWGMFGTLRDLMGAEDTLLGFYDHPEVVRDIIRTNTDLWLALYERVAARLRVDHIHIWEDMSGKQGSLISMAMVEEFMMPEYDRVVAFARAHGIPIVSVDSDGWVTELLATITRHGINAFMPFEVQAGNDVVAVRREHPTLGIMGGLDKSALAKGRAEIHRDLDRAARMFERPGYVVGFDHLIPPDVSWANFKYAMEEIRKLVGL